MKSILYMLDKDTLININTVSIIESGEVPGKSRIVLTNGIAFTTTAYKASEIIRMLMENDGEDYDD